MGPDGFRKQTLILAGIGAVLLLLGLMMPAATGGGGWIVLGAMLLALFGILRPTLRRRWFRTMQAGDARQQAAAARLISGPAGGFWRYWLHLNADGGDRDANV